MSQRAYQRTTVRCLLLTASVLLSAPGCGPKGPRPVPVSGMVTIDGQPLTGGFIRIVPDGGRPAGGKIAPDGRFALGCFTNNDGCIPGTHKVEVLGFEDLSETRRKWLAPRKYASIGTSGLTVTIDGPTDALKINLTWAGSGQTGPSIEETTPEFRGGKRSGVGGGKQ